MSPLLQRGSIFAASLTVALLGTFARAEAQTQAPATAPPPASAEADSYSLGLSMGSQYRAGGLGQGPGFSFDALVRGIKDGLGGKALSADDRARVSRYLKEVTEAVAARNKSQAEVFLAKNAKQKGIVTTSSGLQYEILAAGEAGQPKVGTNDRVKVQYRGKLLDGSEFDSSYARGQPAVIGAANVIAGWREALALMSPGAKWRLFVPPDLAYGTTPPTPTIPANALLIFEVELLAIEPSSGARPAAAPR